MGCSILGEAPTGSAAGIAEEASGGVLHLSMANGGSCEHYYHFLLGYLLPLAAFLARRRSTDDRILLVRSCGPLDRVTCELALPSLLLCERSTHAGIKALIAHSAGCDIEEVAGFDFGRLPEDECQYDIAGIEAGIKFVRLRLAGPIALATAKIDAVWRGRPRVLMIERGEPDPFYQSSLAEHRNASNKRRSIANHRELAKSMAAAYRGFQNLQIETTPLAEQIAMFGLADIVVAQYGAALANIVWMRRGAHVIEIAPDTRKVLKTVFSQLAQSCGVDYARIRQDDGPFGPVPILGFAALLASAAEAVKARQDRDAENAFAADRRFAS
jgi:hypothetical protein